MKKILFLIFVSTLSANAQVDNYDYLFFADKIMANTNNSQHCLQVFYSDLKEYKKSNSFRFRYFESYNCIEQPEQKRYDQIKNGPASFIKTASTKLWKLYNDCYAKNGEIITYLRLEDYKTDIERGFRLVSEMQELQIAIGKVRDEVAAKVASDAKTVPNKSYQMMLQAILHEEDLIRKLSQNFNTEMFIGYPKEDVVKSFLETDDIIKTLQRSGLSGDVNFKQCVEALKVLQKTKENSLDNFCNTSTFDGDYSNRLYDNLQTNINNDLLHYFANYSAQVRLNYYPMLLREYDFKSPAKVWSFEHLDYTPATIDSVTPTRQPAPLPTAAFRKLDDIVYFIDESVRSMGHLYQELRSEESTWNDLHEGDMPYKNPTIKFDKFFVQTSLHALLIKDKENLPAAYRTNLVAQINDIQQIMLSIQDHLILLSQHMKSGEFRTKGTEIVDREVKKIESLYTEANNRKEKLFMQTRRVYAAFPPKKTNSFTVAGAALLKAADDSRRILRQVELRVYEKNETPFSTTAIHEDQRDLIVNQMKYMRGIIRSEGGSSPYRAYEYIPDYLKTLEEKIQDFPTKIDNPNKTYGDILYMHNIIAEQYYKFALTALGENEFGNNDPMTPVYILGYIRQPPIYHYTIPPPREKKVEVVITPRIEPDIVENEISFEGYPFNNLVLLLDVSSSMNAPERLPLLKKSFQQLVRLMRKEDEVSIVVYSGKATVQLPPQSASDTTRIMNAIQNLRSDGKTNVIDGLELAYKTANKNFIENGNNKIIIATDGEFNTGESLYKLVEKNSATITLSVFDFSQRAEALKPIQLLAEKGKGNYVKVTVENSLEVLANEAQKN